MTTQTDKLNDLFKPGQPLPADTVMVTTALDILNHSPHGQKLADFAINNTIDIRIMATPHPTTYLPEPNKVYIGFNRNNPVTPSRFVLMLAGVLREAQQEHAGVKHPHLHAPIEEHLKIGLAKQEDKLWYICAIAYELDDQEAFAAFKFVQEVENMGHKEILDLFTKQERDGQ